MLGGSRLEPSGTVEADDAEEVTADLHPIDDSDPTAEVGARVEVSVPAEPADQLLVRLAWVALALAQLPLVVAAVRAIRAGWVPVGDSALIAIRSQDVLGGGDLPLIGMWASSSWGVGFHYNHPGPLLYDLLAVPAALFPGGTGQVVGATLIGTASVLGIFLAAQRRGGPLLAVVAMAVTGVLCWAMGSAVLVEPWHANTVLLPFLCFVLLAWSVAAGDEACLPWAVGVGSLVLQTNLSYGVFVPALLLWGVGAMVLRSRQAGAEVWVRRLPGRLLAASALVGLVCWAQPLAEQVSGPGEGNLGRTLRSLGEPTGTLNWVKSFGVVAKVVSLPPWWARPSFSQAFTFGAFGNRLPSLAVALVALAVVGWLLHWTLRDARRRSDQVAMSALAAAGVLLVLSVVTANQAPTDLSAGTVAYQLRWLWPAGAFVWLALLTWLVRRLGGRPASTRRIAGGLILAALVVAALNLPWSNQGTTALPNTLPVARQLVRAVADHDLDGPLLVECGETVWDPYCEAVMFELERRGVPVVVRSELGVRQLGEQRRWDGDNAAGLLRVTSGDWAVFPPEDADLLVRLEAIDEEERLELLGLREDIAGGFDRGEIRLNEGGRKVARAGDLDSVPKGSTDPVVDAERAGEPRPAPHGFHLRDLVLLVREDLLDVRGETGWSERLDRYADLQERWDTETVAVWLQPISEAPPPEEPVVDIDDS
jgi:hypothetical protein